MAEHGFLAWNRAGDVVLMAAELELAAWDTWGRKFWTVPVEPPWEDSVEGNTLALKVAGQVRRFRLQPGP